MTMQERLLRLLADGELHSGNELAAELELTRAAVWKHVRQLESLDLQIDALTRLAGPRVTRKPEIARRQAHRCAVTRETDPYLTNIQSRITHPNEFIQHLGVCR